MLKNVILLSGLVSTAAAAWEVPTPLPYEAEVDGDCLDVEVYYDEELKQLEYNYIGYEAY